MAARKGSATDGGDLEAAQRAFVKDLLLEVRQTVSPSGDDGLRIHTVVFRDTEGVKIGIWQESVVWKESDIPLLSKMLAALHRAYWKSSDMAHNGQRPNWAKKNGH